MGEPGEHDEQQRLALIERQLAHPLHDWLPAAQRRRIGPAGVGVVERKSADVPTVQVNEASRTRRGVGV